MRDMAVVLDGDAAEPAAGEAAEAPEAVQGRHDGARQLLLHHHRIGVHGDVGAAGQAAEQEQRDRRGPDIGRQRDQQQPEGARRRQHAEHAARAVPRHQIAGPWHCRQRAQPEAEDQQAEREFGDVEPRQHERDLRRPAAGQEAVDEEDGGDCPAAARGCGDGVAGVHEAVIL